MTDYNLNLPDGVRDLVEGIVVSDTGSVLVRWKKTVFVTLMDADSFLTMCEFGTTEILIHVEDVEKLQKDFGTPCPS